MQCTGCGKSPASLCTSCKEVRYCGGECQRVAWPSHKLICNALRKAKADMSTSKAGPRFEDLLSMAESGDVSAAALVAQGYATGEGVSLDKSAALKWYGIAGEKGDFNAAFNAGQLHFAMHQLKEALKCYEIAAGGGHIEAMFNLGEACREEGDTEGAIKWLRKASEGGHDDATHNLNILEKMKAAAL